MTVNEIGDSSSNCSVCNVFYVRVWNGTGVARMLNNPDTSTMDNLIKGLIALGEPISKIAACLLLCTSGN